MHSSISTIKSCKSTSNIAERLRKVAYVTVLFNDTISYNGSVDFVFLLDSLDFTVK